MLAVAGAGGAFVLTRPSGASIVDTVRGLEGNYRVAAALGAGAVGQRVIITARTIEYPGRGIETYEDLGGGRLQVRSADGRAGAVYRWRWDGPRLLMWDARFDESMAMTLEPE